MFFGVIVRFIMESYIELCIAILLNFSDVKIFLTHTLKIRFKPSAELVASFTLPVFAFLAIIPVFAALIQGCFPRGKGGVLYEDMRETASQKIVGRMNPLIYFVRRGLLVSSAVYMRSYP
jgi:hypothetical protein